MDQSRVQSAFFIGLFGLVLVLNFIIFKAYFVVLLLALTLAVLFYPVYKKNLHYLKRKNLAALVTLLVILLIVIIPLSFLAQRLFIEVQGFILSLSDGNRTFVTQLLEKLKVLNASSITLDLNSYLKTVANSILSNVGVIFSGIFRLILSSILLLLSLFFFLRDGEKIKKAVYELSPFPESVDEKVFDKMELAINSVIRGQLVVAIIQAIVAIIGFSIFGIPNPVLWGSLVVVAAFVPVLGTSSITIPAILYLYLNGHVGASIGLIIWSIAAVGLIDNVLAPIIINRKIQIHPLIILLAVLGGIRAFGAVGFIIGPLILTMLVALFEVRGLLYKN